MTSPLLSTRGLYAWLGVVDEEPAVQRNRPSAGAAGLYIGTASRELPVWGQELPVKGAAGLGEPPVKGAAGLGEPPVKGRSQGMREPRTW
jgi:hypothetical protein